uniref:Mitochondrialprocessing peptidase subunit alpha puta n=1 Tax=Albugo laibachii Nc14 TaxID=890382 RepID=F0WDC1_9STRA|nr:mitochondrialprocessing peptidase subunit alpha puta [Albugo laibachii Nc14]|eukprot:CCA19193.1 mitochondrialprocessing peptidase subunit alpha puta [Albugo laibachii Nc14]
MRTHNLLRTKLIASRALQPRTHRQSISASFQKADFSANSANSQPANSNGGTIKVSVTPSGLKTASDDGYTPVASLGIYLSAGSSMEMDTKAGLSHLFSKMAFRSTKLRSDLRLYRDIEKIGGIIEKQAGRNFVQYHINVLPDNLEEAFVILSETTLTPCFHDWDIKTMKQNCRNDYDELMKNGEASVMEALHAAAFYDDVSLGRPVYSLDNLETFDGETLWKFYDSHVNKSNSAITAYGIKHELLTSMATAYFSELPTSSTTSQAPASKYVGGEYRVKNLSHAHTYVALAFQTGGKSSNDYANCQVLKALLSARLRGTNMQGFLVGYDDVGLVGAMGYAPPEEAGALVDRLAAELKKIASNLPSQKEVDAAKSIATLDVLSESNVRSNRMSILGSAALSQALVPTQNIIFDGVTANSIMHLAHQSLKKLPSLASVGRLSNVPHLQDVLPKLK